jgi:hypothetical protein
MKLLVSGDSWTSCWPLEEQLGHRKFGWPSLVAQSLNIDLVDKSRAGSSNYRIYRKTFDEMLLGNIDISLVFLTSWTRFETGSTYGEKPGRIYQHLATGSAPETQYFFKKFFNSYKNYTDMLRMIISLQSLAKTVGASCYFLDTIDNNLLLDITLSEFKRILSYNIKIFENTDDQRILDKFNKVKNLTNIIDKSSFISMTSYQTLIRGCKLVNQHPVQDGHAKIAKIIVDFLKEKHFGKTI